MVAHAYSNYSHMSKGDVINNSTVQDTEISKSITNIEAKVASLEFFIHVTQTHLRASRAKTRNTHSNRIRYGSNSESDTYSDNIYLFITSNLSC